MAYSQHITMESVSDQIADICIEEWPTYGILPSIAVGQSFVESTLGRVGSNLFGVNGCSGLDVASATYRYLQCMHNRYFRGEMAHITDREEQLAIIMKGGRYCEGQYPYGSYYYNVIRSIYRYGWDRYDDALLQKLDEEKQKETRRKAAALRRKRHKEPFRVIFSNDCEVGTCITDPKWIKKGSTVIFGFKHYEVVRTKKGLRNTIILHDPWDDWRDDIFEMWSPEEAYLTDVIENAKG